MLRMLSAVRALRSSAEILARAADAQHTAGTRRVSAARIAPTSSRIVTQIQSDSSRADSPVRVRYAQPGSVVSVGRFRLLEDRFGRDGLMESPATESSSFQRWSGEDSGQ